MLKTDVIRTVLDGLYFKVSVSAFHLWLCGCSRAGYEGLRLCGCSRTGYERIKMFLLYNCVQQNAATNSLYKGCYVCVCVSLSVWMSGWEGVDVCVCVRVSVHVSMRMYIRVGVGVHVCTYVCVHVFAIGCHNYTYNTY